MSNIENSKVKYISSQDAGLKTSAKKSGETSLNLSNEIMKFIIDPIPKKGSTSPISFLLYKEDFLKGLACIIVRLPLYKSSSTDSREIKFTESYFNELYSAIQDFFGDDSVKEYNVTILRRSDKRIYLNELKQGKFSIRDFLIEGVSVLLFSKDDSGRNIIRLDINENINKVEVAENIEEKEYKEPRQIIFYGAPGTGKSYKINELLQEREISKEYIFRTTFHPDSDYSTFVGSYKPTKGERPLYGLNGPHTIRMKDGDVDLSEEVITYKFTPQTFINAYIQAHKNPEHDVYLIIEELNRGNCAQIFGDLFQLLDRNQNGISEYPIKADTDLKAFLEEEFKGTEYEGIKNGELCLPSNLYIYATMNTSDQSLFPIDSAFKRRWDWEYEPIKYKNADWSILIQGERYSWVSFQKEINRRIFEATKSEDKMLGDYFVNPSNKVITEEMLLNKILFYLWNDVCKDGEGDIFKTSETKDITFSELYGDNGTETLVNMIKYLNIEVFNEKSQIETEIQAEQANLEIESDQ